MDDDSFSGGGQGNPPTGAFEQLNAQLTFQTLDAPAEMTGRNIVALRCSPEVEFVSQCDGPAE